MWTGAYFPRTVLRRASFTSLFLRVYMKGFNTGVTMVLSTVIALVRSKELSTEVLTCKKIVEPYQIRTTVRWEEQVEKARRRP